MKEHVCKGLKFEDCELAILRMQVDEAEKKVGKRLVNSDEVQKILRIVETFIRRRGLVCYGGLAIDRLLPDDAKIYNKDVDLPDYDFFSRSFDSIKEFAWQKCNIGNREKIHENFKSPMMLS